MKIDAVGREGKPRLRSVARRFASLCAYRSTFARTGNLPVKHRQVRYRLVLLGRYSESASLLLLTLRSYEGEGGQFDRIVEPSIEIESHLDASHR